MIPHLIFAFACFPLALSYTDGDLILAGGPTQLEGRLMVYWKGLWGTVCDDGFNQIAANVACRQMFNASHNITKAETFASNTYPLSEDSNVVILLDNVRCNGSELYLANCSHNGMNSLANDCIHKEDINLVCGETDHCDPNPCQNGGLCTDGAGAYTCTCKGSWIGTDCNEYDNRDPNATLKDVALILTIVFISVFILLAFCICFSGIYWTNQKRREVEALKGRYGEVPWEGGAPGIVDDAFRPGGMYPQAGPREQLDDADGGSGTAERSPPLLIAAGPHVSPAYSTLSPRQSPPPPPPTRMDGDRKRGLESIPLPAYTTPHRTAPAPAQNGRQDTPPANTKAKRSLFSFFKSKKSSKPTAPAPPRRTAGEGLPPALATDNTDGRDGRREQWQRNRNSRQQRAFDRHDGADDVRDDASNCSASEERETPARPPAAPSRTGTAKQKAAPTHPAATSATSVAPSTEVKPRVVTKSVAKQPLSSRQSVRSDAVIFPAVDEPVPTVNHARTHHKQSVVSLQSAVPDQPRSHSRGSHSIVPDAQPPKPTNSDLRPSKGPAAAKLEAPPRRQRHQSRVTPSKGGVGSRLYPADGSDLDEHTLIVSETTRKAPVRPQSESPQGGGVIAPFSPGNDSDDSLAQLEREIRRHEDLDDTPPRARPRSASPDVATVIRPQL